MHVLRPAQKSAPVSPRKTPGVVEAEDDRLPSPFIVAKVQIFRDGNCKPKYQMPRPPKRSGRPVRYVRGLTTSLKFHQKARHNGIRSSFAAYLVLARSHSGRLTSARFDLIREIRRHSGVNEGRQRARVCKTESIAAVGVNEPRYTGRVTSAALRNHDHGGTFGYWLCCFLHACIFCCVYNNVVARLDAAGLIENR